MVVLSPVRTDLAVDPNSTAKGGMRITRTLVLKSLRVFFEERTLDQGNEDAGWGRQFADRLRSISGG